MARDNFRDSPSDEEQFKFDPYAHATTVIQEYHRMIHDGFYFDASGIEVDVANGANFDILFKLGAGEITHLTAAGLSLEDTPVNLEWYEGTTVSADGTAINVRNHNRVNGNDSFNIAITKDPTITDVGTLLHTDYIPTTATGPNAGALISHADVEWLIGSPTIATAYLLRITNNTGALLDIGYHFNGYEVGYNI